MHTLFRNHFKISTLLLVVMALIGSGLSFGTAQAASLPASPCISSGGVATCNLWATSGSLSLPDGASVPIWGYAETAGATLTQPGGPVLIVNQGDAVTVTLTNELPEDTGLLFQGQELVPDQTGAATGATATYTFTASNPGTFLYEAGLLVNAQHQVAMGLYGALVVRPAAPGQAYDAPASAFEDEALVVLSEIDPALNSNPAAFDLRSYAPKYFLINGQAYPNTANIDSLAGNRVLLRYVNAGLQYHSMASLGLRQVVLANDGHPLQYSHSIVAETIGPGQTADVLVTIPATTTDGSRFALYDGNLLMHNSNGPGFGGMLTFLSIGAPPPPGADTTGPTAAVVTLTPSKTNGSIDVSLTATISDAASGGSNIQAAEYYIDNTSGAPVSMTASDGGFDSPTEAVQATLTTAILSTLSGGSHTIYVRGQDSAGNWGPFNSAALNLDKNGPTTSALNLIAASSNGSFDVVLSGTADDQASGGSNIAAAEYSIDSGPAIAMALSTTVSPVAEITATIPAATVAALAEGSHTISVRSQDALLNWGAPATVTLTVDQTGPTTSAVAAVPNPTNGVIGYNTSTPAVRVTASLADSQTALKAVEGFIDTVGANGSGFPLTASDGVFNTPTENAYADLPLTTISALSNGNHTVYVHGRDAAGNWGATSSTVLVVDKSKPVVSNVIASPNPTNGTADNNISFILSASADGTGTNVVAAEWYGGVDPGLGLGNPLAFTPAPTTSLSMTINFVALGWTPGNHTVSVRAKDAAGNWSNTVSIVVNVVYPNNIFADGFESGNFSAWSTTGGTTANLSVISGGAQAGSYLMRAQVSGGASGYVQDNTPFVDGSYHARFYFNPNGYSTGNGNNPGVVTIFNGLNSTGTAIFQIQYRRSNNTGYQVRLSVTRAGGTTNTNWYTITNNAWNAIEIAWQSGGAAQASLYTGGTLRQTLTNLNTTAYTLDTVRLGPQGTLPGTGAVLFDSFVSTRRTVVGP
ncbi:MAG: multicopper oxidase domain-containing protein [Chloroflexi bacterium]|nr:multicopper oxidase domain-containing protein [Chloroflexota bacterium]